MLLADGKETSGPEDPFKVGRVMKSGSKPVPDKVTNICHVDAERLLGVAEVRQDHKQSVKWSQQTAAFQCKERLFDKIIAEAKANEDREARRLDDVEALAHQRKRGTKDVTSSDQSLVRNTQPMAVGRRAETLNPKKSTISQNNASRSVIQLEVSFC